LNEIFLGDAFGPFRQKRIILTLPTRRFDTQSEKAYHFLIVAFLKWVTIRKRISFTQRGAEKVWVILQIWPAPSRIFNETTSFGLFSFLG